MNSVRLINFKFDIGVSGFKDIGIRKFEFVAVTL